MVSWPRRHARLWGGPLYCVMSRYTDITIDHFENPRNLGQVDSPDGVGMEGIEGQGNFMVITLKVEAGMLVDARFRTYSCPSARACGSAATVLAKGRTLQEAKAIAAEDIQDFLGRLPLGKERSANVACAALRRAIRDYEHRTRKG